MILCSHLCKHAGCFHSMSARSWHRMLSSTLCPSCPDMWWWLIKTSLYLVECLDKVRRSWLTPRKKILRKEFHACVYKASSCASNLLLTCWPGASALQRFTTEPQARVKKYISIHTLVSMNEKKAFSVIVDDLVELCSSTFSKKNL